MGRKSPTEGVLESTRDLDRWSVKEILEAIHREDRFAFEAVGQVLPCVEAAADVICNALAGGGRWFNAGAGTSGRMGALDAAEIPPTFGLPADRVQAVLAGGERALVRAVEGAEDDGEAAGRELRIRGLCAGDVVLAISASGETPFALGSLAFAREVGARTLALSCNPGSSLAEAAEIAMLPEVGPEVIAGSTRMKGGLAQKMVLHMLSTAVMVRLGRVSGNLMTNMVPASNKLRERSVGIVMALAEVAAAAAAAYLEAADGNAAEAVALAKRDAESR
ncbi:MAG: N-acetylmuramic acid 6-phosphate etherase [Myxococcota bacterium]